MMPAMPAQSVSEEKTSDVTDAVMAPEAEQPAVAETAEGVSEASASSEKIVDTTPSENPSITEKSEKPEKAEKSETPSKKAIKQEKVKLEDLDKKLDELLDKTIL